MSELCFNFAPVFRVAHSVITGTTACLGLGIVAMLTKVGKKEGWRLSGEPRL